MSEPTTARIIATANTAKTAKQTQKEEEGGGRRTSAMEDEQTGTPALSRAMQ
jgi:hypothetical protein